MCSTNIINGRILVKIYHTQHMYTLHIHTYMYLNSLTHCQAVVKPPIVDVDDVDGHSSSEIFIVSSRKF